MQEHRIPIAMWAALAIVTMLVLALFAVSGVLSLQSGQRAEQIAALEADLETQKTLVEQESEERGRCFVAAALYKQAASDINEFYGALYANARFNDYDMENDPLYRSAIENIKAAGSMGCTSKDGEKP